MPDHEATPAAANQDLQTATLGAGCFWCIEAVLERIDGVTDVVSGYMGGAMPNPDYDSVCSGRTGHAEVVQVTFNPKVLSYEALLDWFFQAHDPTTLNRQGPDRGTQYRSAIFLHTPGQRPLAEAAKRRAAELYADPIVTEISEASTFWVAEDYHQDFFARNPGHGYCNFHIPPKLKKLGLDNARKQDG